MELTRQGIEEYLPSNYGIEKVLDFRYFAMFFIHSGGGTEVPEADSLLEKTNKGNFKK